MSVQSGLDLPECVCLIGSSQGAKMKNVPAFKAALLAAGGIIVGRQFPGYSYLFLAAAISSSVIVLLWFLLRREHLTPIIEGCVYAALVFSFAFYMSMNSFSLSTSGSSGFKFFTGTVEETPRDTSSSTVILKNCFGYDQKWKRIEGDLVMSPSFRSNLSIGDRVIFVGKAVAISGARNPGDFNLKSYYELSGIAGRVFVKNRKDIIAVSHDGGVNVFRDIIEPVRNSLRNRIARFMSGSEAELARAMVIGERYGISKEINEQFINTGTIHILSVSGLHIGFLTGMLMIIVSILRIPRRLRFFAIAPVLVFYALVVGLVPSITRAVIMALVVLFGLFLQRKPQVLNSLGFAALVILTLSSSQLFTPGFQLSFAAVMSIAFFHQRILAMVNRSYPNLVERPLLSSTVSLSVLTIAATLGTIPLTAYYFNRISLVSVFANLLIVPLSGVFTTMTFTFVGISVLSSWLAGIFGAASQLLGFAILKVNSMLGTLSISSVMITDSGWIFALLYFSWLIAVIAFPRSSSGVNVLAKKAIFGILFGADIALYANLFSSGFIIHNNPEARLYVLDVGQGDAIYIELPDGRNMLVDAGMKFQKYDIGERVIVPFLRRRGVRELNYFVITHLHGDHIGGAAAVMDKIKVDNFVHPDQFSNSQMWTNTLARVHAFKIPERIVSAGMILDSASMYRVYIMHPNRKYAGESGLSYKKRLNDGSIVLKVCVGKRSFLLVGDIENRVEEDLIDVFGSFLTSDIYKAGHHGSSTSSSAEFLKAVDPNYAVISVGANNSFGHPSQSVVDEMLREGIRVWRTDSLGAAVFRVSDDTARMVQWK
jgi:competence protein ComEC